MSDIGPQISAWRKFRGFSQEDLAQRAAISRPNLSAIEKTHRDLTLSTLRRLAEALNISAGTLIDEAPAQHQPLRDRHQIDELARCVANGNRPFDPPTNNMLNQLALLIKTKLKCFGSRGYQTIRRLQANDGQNLFALGHLYGADFIQRILKRTDKYLE